MATPPFRVKAQYDYTSKEPDDLNFPNGQIIMVTDEEDADWYYGEYEDSEGNKQEGLFPKNFVKIYEPETPPRPSRISRSKKELDSSAGGDEGERRNIVGEAEVPSPEAVTNSAPSEAGGVSNRHMDAQKQHNQLPKIEPPPAAPAASTTTKPAPPSSSKPTPPPTAEKPSSGSFRDRINAFNKPAAPPVAPNKPSGYGSSGSGFIKKPFVAPPPSKNAYVPPPREPPPQKLYRREEDPEIAARAPRENENEDLPSQAQVTAQTDDTEDLPKPTSLKDRIALLQKQQMEQAARHAEAGQKKEKPKRPPRKHVEPHDHALEQGEDVGGDPPEPMNSGETTGKRSADIARSTTRSRKSREATPVGSPVAVPSRELLNDPNDADQSGVGDTEDGEELSTGRDDSDEKPTRKTSLPPSRQPQAPVGEAEVGDEEDNAEEEDDEENGEDEIDPEVKRRMEIRERMAKMSGGMGMAGMFGPPGGLPPRTTAKQASGSSERKASSNSTSGQTDISQSRAPPVPIMPMPGLYRVRSPEEEDSQPEVGKEEIGSPKSLVQGRDPADMPDVEDMREEPLLPSRRSTERSAPPPIPQDRPVPPPSQSRGPPPPIPSERPVAPPLDSRSLPPSSQPLSPSEGSESDDEMSLHNRSSLRLPPEPDSARPGSRGGPPALPSAAPPPSLPSRPAAPQSRPSDYAGRSPNIENSEMSPSSPTAPPTLPNRSSRVPPIPGVSPILPSMPHNRAPPPPPSNAHPSQATNGNERTPPFPPPVPKAQEAEESDEEITEYEGDYDTDMASSAPHKDALKSYARVPSLEEDSMTEDTTLHHPGLPSLGPPMSSAPRAVPPPPPSQPPRNNRQSSDMPRAAPPPPPPPKQQAYDEEDEDYDPYRYSRSGERQTSGPSYEAEGPTTPKLEDAEPSYLTSSPQRAVPPPTGQASQQYASPSNISAPNRSAPRQSVDVQRSSTTIRRSTDGPRASGEQGFIAADVDLGQPSQWWARPDNPPPVFQNRRDLIFEIEETNTTRRGGKQAITKTVYVLFMDYSQTVVTAQFEAKDPSNASLEQRHEPPPQNLRQDQLEAAHAQFGSRIAESASSKEGAIVGDGSPHALVLDIFSALPDALLPVGVRAYGALVYANLANASVRQFDEIRPGDIVTFRNSKFQGHRGAMHSKYSVEVGKPDHVGVVIDWDGTKKKVRAWEQGRESKKVKAESFKFGDMKSGEVKVWRVMARNWVGWEGQN